ncbi:Flp pilus assembly protein [Caenibius tardaugens NBRC 16725]|uniref:Flp pilus assembly protein n=1 Tax=Caenibius tardaugens NBRC 16725 TaxID=1219035 RepID=U2YAN2_9SPHN|nr:type II and III secretion system protein family protein [Caenibius tardaugens]AZI35426.1 type II and III secretion system protein family protein [Caenibius tardaugens NBRC 16725]GAD50481.1 Flp pilus assembly protein [Caenibius tardaugens NBRC 16725]
MASDIIRALRMSVPAALLALAVAAPAPALAQYREDRLHGGTLEVPMNKSQVVTADQAIAKAMVGNPEIADIVPLTDRSIYVLGKTMGTTSLTLYDRGGRVLVVMDVAVGPDAIGYREQLARIVPNTQIEAQTSGNALILTGMANDPGAIDRAVQLARTYAGQNVVNMVGLGSSQQVMLEVKFAEIKRSVGEDIGVRGFAKDGRFGAASGPGASLTDTDGVREFGVGSVLNSFGIVGGTFRALGMNFEAYLDALENKGFAKTLAEPTLIALSGEKASFLAGGEFPIPVVQSGRASGDNGGAASVTVEFKPFGVSLGFTPTVLGDRTINLKVEPEVSAIDPAASIQLNGISIPGLQTRRASTTLELRDGESFAIAGLLQRDFKTTINQVPMLGSIPIIGSLFRSTQFQKGETELLIIVTPRLVRPIRPDQVRLPTDRVKDPDAVASVLLGEPYDPVPLPQGQGQGQAQPANPAADATSGKGGDYEY